MRYTPAWIRCECGFKVVSEPLKEVEASAKFTEHMETMHQGEYRDIDIRVREKIN